MKKLSDGLAVSVGGITTDKLFSLETVRCLGACGLAPVVVVDKDTLGAVSAVKAMDIIQQYE